MSASRRRFVLVSLLAALGAACGVTFTSPNDGTELFKGLTVSGEPRAGAALMLSVRVTQTYPVPVRVACYYEDFDRLTDDQKELAFLERATLIGETVLPAGLDRRFGEEAPEETLSFDFTIDTPGSYHVACLTPAAPENAWGEPLKIEGPTDGSADDASGAGR